MAEASETWVRSPRLLKWTVYLTVALLVVIALDIWSDWGARALAIAATVAFGLLYQHVGQTMYSQRGLYVYFAIQLALAGGLLAAAWPRDPHYILFIILCIQALLILPLRPALVWAGLAYLVVTVGVFWGSGTGSIVESIYNIAAFALTGAFGYTIRQAELARRRNEQLVEELRAAQRQLKELAVDEERNRLARELHDSVKQQVFAIGMQLGAARASLDEGAEAYAHVAEAEKLTRQAAQELTLLIRELRPPGLRHQTLAATLQAQVDDWSRQSGIAANVRLTGEAALPPAAEAALLRVAQEALSNVARHSQATAVEINLEHTGRTQDSAGATTLTIQDNGHGFEMTGVALGVGLDSMRERMEALGGELTMDSQPGAGARVAARIEDNHE
jgi:signal transduction histidine kinase